MMKGVSVPLTDYDFPDAPGGWVVLVSLPDGRQYKHRLLDWTVILSAAVEDDGRRWLHFSTAFPHRLPTWDEYVKVKELFCGKETRAIQVIAPRSEWVNIHPYCLHGFVCLDEDVVPDFRRGRGVL